MNTNAPRKYEVSRNEALLLHRLVDSHCQALKNWIAGAVEHNKIEYAKELIAQLREHEKLYAKLNVLAHEEVSKIMGE